MAKRGRKSNKIEREANVAREMNNVWESWDYHLQEKLEGADRIIRQMIKELALIGSNEQKSIEFIKPRFYQMVKELGMGED